MVPCVSSKVRNFLLSWGDVSFDSARAETHSVSYTVTLNVRFTKPLLPLGIPGADRRAGAFCTATAGDVLAVHHLLWRISRCHCLYRRGGASGRRTAARRHARVRPQVAHTDGGNANPG